MNSCVRGDRSGPALPYDVYLFSATGRRNPDSFTSLLLERVGGRAPGLLFDDCFISAEAPSDTADALLAATEAALRTAGALRLVASCQAASPLRPVYERHGYEPVTLYMAKHRFSSDGLPSRVQPASAEHVPGIVKRSAEHRRTLANINPGFWHIHPEADSRFDAWMRRSLTLKDRDMFVAVEVGAVHGYVIAQPISPLLVPTAHEVAAIGVIDDFYDDDFADVSAVSNGGSNGESLLAADSGRERVCATSRR